MWKFSIMKWARAEGLSEERKSNKASHTTFYQHWLLSTSLTIERKNRTVLKSSAVSQLVTTMEV